MQRGGGLQEYNEAGEREGKLAEAARRIFEYPASGSCGFPTSLPAARPGIRLQIKLPPVAAFTPRPRVNSSAIRSFVEADHGRENRDVVVVFQGDYRNRRRAEGRLG